MSIQIDGGILAGGLARRMGGQNKGLALYNGEAMLASIAKAMRPYVQTLRINCNRDSDKVIQFCDETVSDKIEGFQGPLAGIHALLDASSADYVLTSSCDTPLLSEKYPITMLSILKRDSETKQQLPLAYYACCNGDSQPTHLLVSPRLSDSLSERIQQNRLRALEWLREIAAVPVSFEEETLFYNVNHPAELIQPPPGTR